MTLLRLSGNLYRVSNTCGFKMRLGIITAIYNRIELFTMFGFAVITIFHYPQLSYLFSLLNIYTHIENCIHLS